MTATCGSCPLKKADCAQCHHWFPDLFNVALPHLQHSQVVVGMSMVVVVDQSQP
jgi:hypothetical protein